MNRPSHGVHELPVQRHHARPRGALPLSARPQAGRPRGGHARWGAGHVPYGQEPHDICVGHLFSNAMNQEQGNTIVND
jgi:hypothetical protein